MSLRIRCGMWSYRFKVKGEEYSGSTGLAATKRNESEARQAEAEHRKQVVDGRRGHGKTEKVKFNEAVRRFLNWAHGEYREHPSTAQRIAVSFASLREFFKGEMVQDLNPGMIEDYKTWRRESHIKEVTIRHDLHSLSLFLKHALKFGWIARNPLLGVNIPSDIEAQRMHIVTAQSERMYFTAAAKHPLLHDLARLILLQGLRPEEVRELRKSDVDLAAGVLHVRRGKTKAARRTLGLTEESKLILGRRMAGSSQWLFPSPRVPLAHIGRLNYSHDEVCRETGLNFCLYDLRHRADFLIMPTVVN